MKNPVVIAKFAGLILLLLVVQIAVVPLLGVGSVQPDIVIIGLVYIAMRFGQLPVLFYAFGAGLLYDLFVGDVIGLSSFANTLAAFAAGYFYIEEKADFAATTSRFIGAVAVAASLHNAVYIISYFRDIDAGVARTLLLHGAGSMLYTVVLSALPVLVLSRRRRRVKV